MENVEHLSSVLRSLHNNDAMRKSLKQNGEKFVREHGDIRASAEKMLEIYREVVAGGWKKFI